MESTFSRGPDGACAHSRMPKSRRAYFRPPPSSAIELTRLSSRIQTSAGSGYLLTLSTIVHPALPLRSSFYNCRRVLEAIEDAVAAVLMALDDHADEADAAPPPPGNIHIPIAGGPNAPIVHVPLFVVGNNGRGISARRAGNSNAHSQPLMRAIDRAPCLMRDRSRVCDLGMQRCTCSCWRLRTATSPTTRSAQSGIYTRMRA